MLGLLAEAAIAEVGDDADDLDVRLGVGSGALADARAERAAAGEIAPGKGLVDDGGALAAGSPTGRESCSLKSRPATILDAERRKNPGLIAFNLTSRSVMIRCCA